MVYILSIDQSTSGTKGCLFDTAGKLTARYDLPHRQMTNPAGWVEHDPEEIYQNTLAVAKGVLEKADITPEAVAAAGISNQRETVLAWERGTGKPLYNAIVWQCNRAEGLCKELAPSAGLIRERTGLMLSPFFSGPKILWMLRNVDGLQEKMNRGQVCFGTVDSWLAYRLTNGAVYKTDVSNASRTSLMNIDTLAWDADMLRLMEISPDALPEITLSDSGFGASDFGGLFPKGLPIRAMLGDSHGALFGNGCTAPGMAKITFGTGSSVMVNVGGQKVLPSGGVVASMAWGRKGKADYALEANINYTGAVIKWLEEDLQMLASSKEAGQIAASVESTGGVYLVPAFTGLSAPHWKSDARAMICGMNRSTKRAHIVRAAEECIAYQLRDATEAMAASLTLSGVYADGGPTRDPFLMQFTADMLGIPVRITGMEELSAAGAAYLAAEAAGLADLNTLLAGREIKEYRPAMEEAQRTALYDGWKAAINMQ